VRNRLEKTAAGIGYADPVKGGRTKPDGQAMQWEVTFPTGATRGEVPFWCHDVTARELRVPTDERKRTHPCGAFGLEGLFVTVSAEERHTQLAAAYEAIFAQAPPTWPFPFGAVPFGAGRVEGVREAEERRMRDVRVWVQCSGSMPGAEQRRVEERNGLELSLVVATTKGRVSWGSGWDQGTIKVAEVPGEK